MTQLHEQDDYYAHLKTDQKNDESDTKKPLKLKLKVKKLESDEKIPEMESTPAISDTPVETPKPQARLIAREPIKPIKPREEISIKPREEILKKEFVRRVSPVFNREEKKDEPKKRFTPAISFKPAPSPFKALENRPVMSGNGSSTPSVNSGDKKRLRDDAKPIFQRNIGYTTPTKDGTGKKGKNGKPYTSFDEKWWKKWVKVLSVHDDGSFRRGHKVAQKKKEKSAEDIQQILVDRTGQEVPIPEVISVKEFSDKIGIPVAKVMAELMKNGMLVSLNAPIDYDTCYLIGETFGIKITKELSDEVSVNDLMDGNIEELLKEDDTSNLVSRPPIISVMGHVDHGKTSILDYIRKSTVAATEAGGITQKIGAYQIEKNGKKITFLDTPGHEAFSIMRARWAKLTDIAVIVVAADEGMKPQTIESINHAKAAEVPVIVAINKMDKPGANPDLVKWQLAEQGLQPEDWGGTTVVVPVSAHTGLGMDILLDMIILQAELLELKANPIRNAVATVIEAHLDQKLGSVATILINGWVIRKGDNIVCANSYGKVRTLKDFKGKNIEEAGPGTPVQITGLSGVVEGGDILQVVVSQEVATERAKEYNLAKSRHSINAFEGASLNMLMARIKSGWLKQLKIVLKCDSNGSLEALKAALWKLSTNETQVTFLHAWVGDINQSDVIMAGTSQALLIGYNVGVIASARSTLSNSKIEFIDKKVIYHILEKVEAIITGMIDIRFEELELGVTKVKAIFYTKKGGSMMIIGLGVESWKIENRAKIRIIRDGRKVGSGEIVNLKMGPLDVHEVLEWDDCGINYKWDVQIIEWDNIEVYKMVQRK